MTSQNSLQKKESAPGEADFAAIVFLGLLRCGWAFVPTSFSANCKYTNYFFSRTNFLNQLFRNQPSHQRLHQLVPALGSFYTNKLSHQLVYTTEGLTPQGPRIYIWAPEVGQRNMLKDVKHFDENESIEAGTT